MLRVFGQTDDRLKSGRPERQQRTRRKWVFTGDDAVDTQPMTLVLKSCPSSKQGLELLVFWLKATCEALSHAGLSSLPLGLLLRIKSDAKELKLEQRSEGGRLGAFIQTVFTLFTQRTFLSSHQNEGLIIGKNFNTTCPQT